jgi:hypothetical protein
MRSLTCFLLFCLNVALLQASPGLLLSISPHTGEVGHTFSPPGFFQTQSQPPCRINKVSQKLPEAAAKARLLKHSPSLRETSWAAYRPYLYGMLLGTLYLSLLAGGLFRLLKKKKRASQA